MKLLFRALALFFIGNFMMPKLDASQPLTILALGDSITAGSPGFLSPREAPPKGWGLLESQYAYWLMKRHPEWTVHNRGVRGQRSDQIRGRLAYEINEVKPDVMIVIAGVNDLYQGRPAEWVKTHLAGIYDEARQKGIKVMACTILPYNGAKPEVVDSMRDVNAWIRAAAESKGMGFCDAHAAMGLPENPDSLVSTDDGIHPDVAGYKRLAGVIADALESWLKASEPVNP